MSVVKTTNQLQSLHQILGMTGTRLLPELNQDSPSIGRTDHLADFVSEDLAQHGSSL
jgi:hypothetical protein